MTEIQIDPEFKDLISPLTTDELSLLEESIKSEGCLDPLSIWNGILVDGHNRYQICKSNKIPFQVREKQFKDRDSAMEWIIRNQLARRNITMYTRTKLVLALDVLYKAEASERKREAGGDRKSEDYYKKSLPQNAGEPISKNPRAQERDHKLGKIAGVSHDTIHRVRFLESKAPTQVKEQLIKGETTIRREYNKLRGKPVSKPRPTAKQRIDKIKELSGQGYRAAQIASSIGIGEERVRELARDASIQLPDAIMGISHKIDINHMLSQTAIAAQSLISDFELMNSRFKDIDLSLVNGWVETLESAIFALKKLVNKLKGAKVDEQKNGREIRSVG